MASDAHVLKPAYRLPLPKAGKNDCLLILSALANLYVRGAHIDWKAFYTDPNPGRIPLPTYPFERQSHWITHTGIPISSKKKFCGDSAGNESQEMIRKEEGDLEVGQFEKSSNILTKLRKISSWEFELVLDYLQDQVSRILSISKSQISGTVNLMQLGMDSLLFLELAKIIERDLKISKAPRFFIQSPHINALGKVITENLAALDINDNSPKEDFFIVPKLRKIASSKRVPILLDYLRDQVSKILRVSQLKILGSDNLMQLGMDSLLFLELVKIVESDLEIKIPPKFFIQSPYIQ